LKGLSDVTILAPLPVEEMITDLTRPAHYLQQNRSTSSNSGQLTRSGWNAANRLGTITQSLFSARERNGMPTKPGLTRREHEELGTALKQLRGELLRIALQLETVYPKLSATARLSYKAAQAVDRLRSALDRQAFLDYCQWEAEEKAQFKEGGGFEQTILTRHG
jgi:hypothetical protein